MDTFLTPVSTTAKHSSRTVISTKEASEEKEPRKLILESPEDVAKALRSQPNFQTVESALRYLTARGRSTDGFNLATPGPLQAQIVSTFVTATIPDYFVALKDHKHLLEKLVICLRNANGLGAIISRLRSLIADCQSKKLAGQTRDSSSYIDDLLEVLQDILKTDKTSLLILEDTRTYAQNPVQEKLMWKEYVGQIASGKLVSIAAQAEDALKELDRSRDSYWLANGQHYASWLGRNLVVLMKHNANTGACVPGVAELLGRVLSFGYLDYTVTPIVDFMVAEKSTRMLELFLPKLKAHEQRKYLEAIISRIAKQFFVLTLDTREDSPINPCKLVSAAATLINYLVKDSETLKDYIVSILLHSTVPALDDSLSMRRAMLAVVAQDEEKLHNLLEQSLKLFGDSFTITHTAILQQEALAQSLAMACGYVQRSQPMFLTMLAKSSFHVSGMSNRIGATSTRARFLGMAIGIAISKLVDKPDLQLTFDLEGTEAAEAKWYQRLTELNDQLGKLESLRQHTVSAPKQNASNLRTQSKPLQSERIRGATAVTKITGPRIMEVVHDSSDDDLDLVPYAKPDSDPEDDTDDPTEINRKKPIAPVYIRDLIAGLGDHENYDRHQLALATAATLIRRKANFGSEVTDHVEELANILVGLSDSFDLPDFTVQRQKALIAVLLAKPGPMAQWFARTLFSGDFSVAQRIAILTTLGLGARELAGLQNTSSEELRSDELAFPSKQLPSHLHEVYKEPSDSVARITSSLTKELLSPLATNAADQLSGPNILKVRTFSSRMEVEKKRSKPIPNALAQIVADNFFFPLTGRWWINTRGSGPDNVYASSHLLPPFLHTLALLLHASGSNTLALPQMTRELWELLLSVRGVAISDKSVLSALLFALLMLLETNENKERLATEQSRELLETQEWVRMVFQGLAAGSEEDEKVRTLAAGVVIRCQEVVEKYQRRMVGSMMDY